MLLRARDADGNPMSDEQVRDEAMTLFLAGHETTAIALSWACYLIAQDRASRRSSPRNSKRLGRLRADSGGPSQTALIRKW